MYNILAASRPATQTYWILRSVVLILVLLLLLVLLEDYDLLNLAVISRIISRQQFHAVTREH